MPSGLAAPYSGLKFFNLTAGILRALTPRAGSCIRSDETKGLQRTCWGHARNDAIDPLRTFRTTDKIVF